jgi:hypothetical protein
MAGAAAWLLKEMEMSGFQLIIVAELLMMKLIVSSFVLTLLLMRLGIL